MDVSSDEVTLPSPHGVAHRRRLRYASQAMLSPDPDAVLEKVRAACLALPETGEKISHGIPAFHVGGKMFAYFRHNHHGDDMTAVCVKTSGRDEQMFLIEADPDLYSRPAYLGPSGWVAINLAPDDTDWTHVGERLRTSWRLAAPKKIAHAHGV